MIESFLYCGFHVTHAPHTCSVSQPLPSHVSRSRNRHQKVAEIDVCTPTHVMSLPSPVNLCQTTWIIDPCGISLYTRTPHIFCLPTTAITCVSTKEYEPKKRWNWRLYTKTQHVAAFIDSFNLCQTASIIEVLGIPLYTGTPHVLSLQTTDIACVSTME